MTREARSIVSVAVTVALAVNSEGQRQVIGMKVGPSEAETFWTEFLHSLMRCGLRGVRLVISDAHARLKVAAAKVLKATWQRCRVHSMRNALAHANKTQRRRVSAAIATALAQETSKAAHEQWRVVADQFRKSMPKLAKLIDDAKHEVLSSMEFPRAHWLQIHSTNPLERLNAEIKRRTNVVGIVPNDRAIARRVGAMLLEQTDEWSLNRRYMQLEGLQSLTDTAATRRSAIQRCVPRTSALSGLTDLPHALGRDPEGQHERAMPQQTCAAAPADQSQTAATPPHHTGRLALPLAHHLPARSER